MHYFNDSIISLFSQVQVWRRGKEVALPGQPYNPTPTPHSPCTTRTCGRQNWATFFFGKSPCPPEAGPNELLGNLSREENQSCHCLIRDSLNGKSSQLSRHARKTYSCDKDSTVLRPRRKLSSKLVNSFTWANIKILVMENCACSSFDINK